ncbi:hypothetical protein QJQ45_028746 [Haematococcus lacustris]|nr:hypothetical protein QJQ45_028746 [Haematococcus lacustris]
MSAYHKESRDGLLSAGDSVLLNLLSARGERSELGASAKFAHATAKTQTAFTDALHTARPVSRGPNSPNVNTQDPGFLEVFPRVASRPPRLLQELDSMLVERLRLADKAACTSTVLPKERDPLMAANLALEAHRQVLQATTPLDAPPQQMQTQDPAVQVFSAFVQGFTTYTGLLSRIQAEFEFTLAEGVRAAAENVEVRKRMAAEAERLAARQQEERAKVLAAEVPYRQAAFATLLEVKERTLRLTKRTAAAEKELAEARAEEQRLQQVVQALQAKGAALAAIMSGEQAWSAGPHSPALKQLAVGPLSKERIGESKQRPLELCSWTDRGALPPVGKEYQQGYKRLDIWDPQLLAQIKDGMELLAKASVIEHMMRGPHHHGIRLLPGEVAVFEQPSSAWPVAMLQQLDEAQPLPTAPGPVPPPQAPSWGRWLDRDTNACLNFQRIGESTQRPLELCSWKDREALAPIGKEYQQGYKRVNDRLPKVRQRLHRAAEYRYAEMRRRNNTALRELEQRKKRTHVPDTPDPSKKGDPKTFVLRRGKHAALLADLEMDVRRMMLPNTALNLQESRRNVLKDFVQVAGPLGVTHFIMLSSTDANHYLKVARTPRGPTLSLRILSYSLMRDVQSAQARPRVPPNAFKTPPLVVLNGFAGQQHLQLFTTMFQSMFPSINVAKVRLAACQRVVLLALDKATGVARQGTAAAYAAAAAAATVTTAAAAAPVPAGIQLPMFVAVAAAAATDADAATAAAATAAAATAAAATAAAATAAAATAAAATASAAAAAAAALPSGVIRLRHYTISLAPSGLRKGLKGLLQRSSLPDMSSMQDVAEFMTRGGYGSESEGEEAEASRVTLGQDLGKGNAAGRASRVRLHEVGPRLELQLMKVEEGLCSGAVLYHALVAKTAEEAAALAAKHEEQAALKEVRRRKQVGVGEVAIGARGRAGGGRAAQGSVWR